MPLKFEFLGYSLCSPVQRFSRQPQDFESLLDCCGEGAIAHVDQISAERNLLAMLLTRDAKGKQASPLGLGNGFDEIT